MVTEQTIEEVKQRLIKTYNPIAIYIFGSYAWGSPDEESDLDILVVIDHLTLKPWEDVIAGHKALAGLGIAKDLLLIDKNRFDQYSIEPRRLHYKIKERGRKIYARA